MAMIILFRSDYRAMWDMEIDGFRQVAKHNPDVRVSVEYKPNDPRRTSLIRSMSDSLLAVNEVGLAEFWRDARFLPRADGR